MSPETVRIVFWACCLIFVVVMGWLWTRGTPAYYDDGPVDTPGVPRLDGSQQ